MPQLRRTRRSNRSRRSRRSNRSRRSRRYRGGDETSRTNLKNNLINRYRSNARNPNDAERDGLVRGLAVLTHFQEGDRGVPAEFFVDINELKRIEDIDDERITDEVAQLHGSSSFDESEDFGEQAEEIMRAYKGQ